MARRKAQSPFPSRQQILEFLRDAPARAGKRELTRAFQLDADQKRDLKELLRQMEQDGELQRGRGRQYAEPGGLPPVAVVEVRGLDADGDVLAQPLAWPGDTPAPVIYMAPQRRGHHALGPGDRVLARLKPIGRHAYEGRVMRLLGAPPREVLGVFERAGRDGRIRPTNRRNRGEYAVADSESAGAQSGELVLAQVISSGRLGLGRAKVVQRLGGSDGAPAVSLIALHDHGIPQAFTEDAVEQAEAAGSAPLDRRVDLRDLPLVTIDGADARDFDDAVWAEPVSGKGEEAWHLIVAIADVSWYVRSAGPLDKAAYERGNSVYFPDRVVPMLPETLSNGWCSLKPAEDRPCLAAHLWIGADGGLKRHRFERAVMRSTARLTYEQAQAAQDGTPDDVTAPLIGPVINPLFGAYAALARHRQQRGVLELDMPERQVVVDETGNVTGIRLRARLDSHRLIEEFMITANVAAAETLERRRQPCMYRVHDVPAPEKLESLREVLKGLGLSLARGQIIQPRQFNGLLERVAGTPHERMVHELVLRSQSQAAYAPDNLGHYGLNLKRYAHFTSPIRRYADLLVHRALIRGLNLGEGGLEDPSRPLEEMGEHLCMTERRAAAAERDAVDRFTAAYLADRVGTNFTGRVTGVTRFGLFVTLDDSGGDGLVPMRSLPDDYYDHNESRHELRGRDWGRMYRLGDSVEVVLVEADPVTGSLVLHILEDGVPPPQKAAGRSGRPRRAPSRPPRRRR